MHRWHMAAKFGVFADEDQDTLPTLFWLQKNLCKTATQK